MYGKIQITGIIEIVTGMHIGGATAFAPIGAVDSPIMKDIRTNLPIIPGSSLKGKLRTLLAKKYNDGRVVRHENDAECIKRLFGCSKDEKNKFSRLIFSDMIMSNTKEIRDMGIQSVTEVKFENTINRLTAGANPRQIERAIRGSRFDLDILYEVDDEKNILDDFKIIKEGMELLEYDYLGGHGSRGYGKIKFIDVVADCVLGEVDDEIMEQCNRIIGK